jgi:glycosyltransferase involved in cell wall biosynthesis
VVAKLWIDVEDLFEYARNNPRPSGIQRLAFEMYQTLQGQHGGSGLINFIRHDSARNSFRVVQWFEIAALFARLVANNPAPVSRQPDNIAPHPPGRQFIRRVVYRLPSSLRTPVTQVLLTQAAAFRAWIQLALTVPRGLLWTARWLVRLRIQPKNHAGGPTRAVSTASGRDFASQVAPGDVLLVLGSTWSHPDYAALVKVQRTRRGLRVALLVYDLIPLRCPEWCDRGLVRLFRAWFETLLPHCDHVFAISRSTAADVEAYAEERGVVLPSPVVPIPIGTGFSTEQPVNIAARTDRLPPLGSYALVVSTIEARKNHALLFRIWRRMLNESPREHVPTLVFAGRVGWLVDDLMRQIANTGYLDGKLMVIENPSDAEIIGLYQGCLFTMFPSFSEGWGLPVTESLAFGKPCLISNRTSLPEAGGALARYFDPDNLYEAYDAICRVIQDREELERWEAQIRREFKPVPWSATVKALLTGLDHPLAVASIVVDTSAASHAAASNN